MCRLVKKSTHGAMYLKLSLFINGVPVNLPSFINQHDTSNPNDMTGQWSSGLLSFMRACMQRNMQGKVQFG